MRNPKATVHVCNWCNRQLKHDHAANDRLIQAIEPRSAGYIDEALALLDAALGKPLSAYMRRQASGLKVDFLAESGEYAEAVRSQRTIIKKRIDLPPVARAYSQMVDRITLCELLRNTGSLGEAARQIRTAIHLGLAHEQNHDTLLWALAELCLVQEALRAPKRPSRFARRALETAAASHSLSLTGTSDWPSFSRNVERVRRQIRRR